MRARQHVLGRRSLVRPDWSSSARIRTSKPAVRRLLGRSERLLGVVLAGVGEALVTWGWTVVAVPVRADGPRLQQDPSSEHTRVAADARRGIREIERYLRRCGPLEG
jgi:hypothetical protein